MKEWLDRISLTKKLSIYIIILLVMFLVFTALLFGFQAQTFTANARSQMVSEIGFAQSKTVSRMSAMQTAVEQIADDEDIISFVDSNHTTLDSTYARNSERVLRRLQQIATYTEDARLYVVSKNDALRSYTQFRYHLSDVLALPWIDSDVLSAANSTKTYWSIGKWVNGETVLICYRGVYENTEPYQIKELVVSSVPVSTLCATMRSQTKTTDTVLVNEDGVAIAATDQRFLRPKTAAQLLRAVSKKEWTRVDGERILTASEHLGDSGETFSAWQIIAVSYYANYFSRLIKALLLIAISFLLALALLIWLTRMVTQNIVKRNAVVLQHIGHIASEDFTINSELDGVDEFYLINEELNGLGIRLNRLIRDELQSQIEHQQLQLAFQDQQIVALQNQINPHYIVNTLEAIRMKLLIRGEEESAQMVCYLAQSLRVYAWSPHSMITVAEEIDFLEQYLVLQNYRFIDKIKYNISAQEDVYAVNVPRFLIQPLIENAIKHGFKNTVSDAQIDISFVRDGEYFYITVEDNGLGMEEETLARLRERFASESLDVSASGGHIGLTNVQHRIRLLYGEDCGMTVESKSGEGTKIIMKLRTDGENI